MILPANEWWECLGIAQVVFAVNLHQLISGAKGGNLKMSTRWYFHCHDQHKTLHFMAIHIWQELHSKWSVANEIMLKLQSEREFKTTNNIYVMPSVFTITTSTCHPWKQLSHTPKLGQESELNQSHKDIIVRIWTILQNMLVIHGFLCICCSCLEVSIDTWRLLLMEVFLKERTLSLITGTFCYASSHSSDFLHWRSFWEWVLHSISTLELGSQDILQPVLQWIMWVTGFVMAREESHIPGFMDQFLWLCKSVSMWISTYADRRETIDVSLIGCCTVVSLNKWSN